MVGGMGATTMTSEFKVVQVPEGDYLRPVKAAQENEEKDFPFTIDELSQLMSCVNPMMGGIDSPLYKKLRGIFIDQVVRERRG